MNIWHDIAPERITHEAFDAVIYDTKGAIASVDIIDDAIRRYKEKFGG